MHLLHESTSNLSKESIFRENIPVILIKSIRCLIFHSVALVAGHIVLSYYISCPNLLRST